MMACAMVSGQQKKQSVVTHRSKIAYFIALAIWIPELLYCQELADVLERHLVRRKSKSALKISVMEDNQG